MEVQVATPNPSLKRSIAGMALGPRSAEVILHFAGQAPYRRCPLSSNVRQQNHDMRFIRLISPLFAGFLAMQALVFVAGFLAARATPHGYFAYFGRERLELALAVWSTFAFSLPMFIAAALLAFGLARALNFSTRAMVAAFATGVVANIATFAYFTPGVAEAGISPIAALWQQAMAYWPQTVWQVPSGPWAGWVGLWAGVAIAAQVGRRHRSGAAA